MLEGEEEMDEDEVGERLAQREGRRRLAGRAGLEKFFFTEEGETANSSFSCQETDELTFRIITPFCLQSNSHSDTLHFVTCSICCLLDPRENNRHISNRTTKEICTLM